MRVVIVHSQGSKAGWLQGNGSGQQKNENQPGRLRILRKDENYAGI